MEMSFVNGMKVAQIVHLHMSMITDFSDHLSRDETDDIYIAVSGFSSMRASGYHFSEQSSGRQCNVCEERIEGGIIFTYGERDDYDFESKASRSSASRIDKKLSEAGEVAKMAMNWLVLGELPEPE